MLALIIILRNFTVPNAVGANIKEVHLDFKQYKIFLKTLEVLSSLFMNLWVHGVTLQ